MSTLNMTINPDNYPGEEEIADNVRAMLKTLRLENNLSQGDICRIVGKSRATLSAWERTDPTSGPIFKPSYRDLCLLSLLYNITIDELLGKTKIPEAAIGITITKHDFFFYNGRPVTYQENSRDCWAIVNTAGQYLVLADGSRKSFVDVDEEQTFQIIPNDIYRKEAMYPEPMALEDLKTHISTAEETMTVWVLVDMDGKIGGSPLDGEYKITENGAERGGMILSFDSYNSRWIAFTEEPAVTYHEDISEDRSSSDKSNQ